MCARDFLSTSSETVCNGYQLKMISLAVVLRERLTLTCNTSSGRERGDSFSHEALPSPFSPFFYLFIRLFYFFLGRVSMCSSNQAGTHRNLLPLPLECWDQKPAPPCLDDCPFFRLHTGWIVWVLETDTCRDAGSFPPTPAAMCSSVHLLNPFLIRLLFGLY